MKKFVKIVSSAILSFLVFNATSCVSSDTNGTEPPKVKTTTVSISSWNVHNFFDKECDSTECTICDISRCTGSAYEKQYTAEKYENKLNNVIAGLKKLDSDIVMLAEIEKEPIVEDILKGLPKYGYHIFGELGTTGGIDVCIISKYPITGTKLHREGKTFTLENGDVKKLARELIEADIEVNETIKLKVFTTHLVSKATDPSGERREKEAEIVSEILKAAGESEEGVMIAFGGDLNDYPDSVPIAILNEKSGLTNSSIGTLIENVTTWDHQARLDYIFHNPSLGSHMDKTSIECETSGTGYSDSDHCAVKNVYKF